MTREQLKKWMKLIIFVIILAFVVMAFSAIITSSGFVFENFERPIIFVIPLVVLGLAGLLYVIYMFIEKGEPLRIIANALMCVLVFYMAFTFSAIRHSKLMNMHRYNEIGKSGYEIINNIFDDSTVAEEESFWDPSYDSIGDMLLYTGTSEAIVTNDDGEETIKCFVDVYCVDNYILGADRVKKHLEEGFFTNMAETLTYDCVTRLEESGSGESDGIDYKWSYGQYTAIEDKRNYTNFAIILTYNNSVYCAEASFTSDELVYIDMEKESVEIVNIVKSMEIFSKYK